MTQPTILDFYHQPEESLFRINRPVGRKDLQPGGTGPEGFPV
jgi:hypothetical protein